MSSIIFLKNTNSQVAIDKGELISFQKDNQELIHQKGNKGWRNSDTEMFPIIGPTSENNFRVHTKKGDAIQDQHGLLRELEYSLISSDEKKANFIKKYKKNTTIKNSKYPAKSTEEHLFWPFDFTFEKNYSLENNVLKIEFIIHSEEGMPFMLGYHPAFLLQGNLDEIVKSKNKEISIPEIQKGGDIAYPVLYTSEITLQKKSGTTVNISTVGFNNFMLWTPAANMLCIEPITAYPYTDGEMLSKELFNNSNGVDVFEVLIS
jgi:galactose mutarotase-like enzyme